MNKHPENPISRKEKNQNKENANYFAYDRAFGKDIKNNGKFIKNIQVNKNQEEKKTKIAHNKDDPFKPFNQNEKKSNLLDTSSQSLTQALSDRMSSSFNQQEYKEIALVNENLSFHKVGKFFLRSNLCQLPNKDELLTADKEVSGDPQHLVDYVYDIFHHLRQTEMINSSSHGYIGTVQNEITEQSRSILVDWIIEVHSLFKLNSETLYLTVNLIDRYLSSCKVEKSKFQLLGVSAMLVACKYEEIYAPEVRDFVYVTDKTYTKEEILSMEYVILKTMNFDILQVSSFTFLKRFNFAIEGTPKLLYLSQYILEFSLLDYTMLKYSSSIKAASSLYIARRFLKMEHSWPSVLRRITCYEVKDIRGCVIDMIKFLDLIPKITLRSCINKFSSPKFMEVAKINIFNLY